MPFYKSKRLDRVPPYLFARIDEARAKAVEKGVDIINLGIGDPDLPTPAHIVEYMQKIVADPTTHDYPSYKGELPFRQAVAGWYKSRFGVDLNPEKEVLSLIGSKEGIAHVFTAFVDPGDLTLIPDPGYPVYQMGTILAGGEPHYMPLREENGLLPDLDQLENNVVNKAKLMFINYPNNPTAAVAEKKQLERIVEFCRKNDILLCSDAAYTEMAFDGFRPPSILEIKGAKDIAIEFHSLSKTYNMTGWRVGMAVGNADAIAALGTIKTNVDSGIFKAIQYSAVTALSGSQECIQQMIDIYSERRDILVGGLNKLGWNLKKPRATFYIWAPVPTGYTSETFCTMMLEKTGIVCVPGNGYGRNGEGYFRLTITLPKQRLVEAITRMEQNNIFFERNKKPDKSKVAR